MECFSFVWLLLFFAFLSSIVEGSKLRSESGRKISTYEIISSFIDHASSFRLNRGETDKEDNLILYIQKLVKMYGEKKVAASVYELSQKEMFDLLWMLAGELDPWLVLDLYEAYSHSQNDEKVLEIYERFQSGNVDRTVVPEVFTLDKKYNEYAWWRRVRKRLMASVEQYIDGSLEIKNGTPPPDVAAIAAGNFDEVIAANKLESERLKNKLMEKMKAEVESKKKETPYLEGPDLDAWLKEVDFY